MINWLRRSMGSLGATMNGFSGSQYSPVGALFLTAPHDCTISRSRSSSRPVAMPVNVCVHIGQMRSTSAHRASSFAAWYGLSF